MESRRFVKALAEKYQTRGLMRWLQLGKWIHRSGKDIVITVRDPLKLSYMLGTCVMATSHHLCTSMGDINFIITILP